MQCCNIGSIDLDEVQAIKKSSKKPLPQKEYSKDKSKKKDYSKERERKRSLSD